MPSGNAGCLRFGRNENSRLFGGLVTTLSITRVLAPSGLIAHIVSVTPATHVFHHRCVARPSRASPPRDGHAKKRRNNRGD